MATLAQRYIRRSDDISRIDFATLPKDALPQFVALVQAAVVKNANSSEGMRPGELRAVFDVDPNTNMKTRRWVGPRPFTDDFMLPPKRVVSFSVPQREVIWGHNAKTQSRGLW
jgi:hypothetical protein